MMLHVFFVQQNVHFSGVVYFTERNETERRATYFTERTSDQGTINLILEYFTRNGHIDMYNIIAIVLINRILTRNY